MTARVLRQDDAILEVGGHVFCAGERGDGVAVCVYEQERGSGLGFLEACRIILLVCVFRGMGVEWGKTYQQMSGSWVEGASCPR